MRDVAGGEAAVGEDSSRQCLSKWVEAVWGVLVERQALERQP